MEPDEQDVIVGNMICDKITEAIEKAGALEAPKNEPIKKERQKERWPEDPPEEKKTQPPDYVDAMLYAQTVPPDIFGIKRARQRAVAEYRQRLKDACLQALAEAPEVIATPETSYSRIGKRVLTELLKDDTEAE